MIAEQGARGQVVHGQHHKGPRGPQERVTLMLNSARGQQNERGGIWQASGEIDTLGQGNSLSKDSEM